MAPLVLKFGGTSVGSAAAIEQVLDILQDYRKAGKDFVVVVSAMGGMTNALVEMSDLAAKADDGYKSVFARFEDTHLEAVRSLISAKGQSSVMAHLRRELNELEDILHGVFLLRELSPRSLDLIYSHGERLSAYLVAAAATERGLPARFADAREMIRTGSEFGKGRVNLEVTNELIAKKLADRKEVPIVTGFIASNKLGQTTTLGRGGSDYTASLLAAALDAAALEIWTDVDGVMTADPRRVREAFRLPAISYVEAMEFSHFGAKVIYPPTVQPLVQKGIPIWIKNTFRPQVEGTLISRESGPATRYRVKGISSIERITLVSVQGGGMAGVTGVASRLFTALALKEVNVVLITQASSEHSITFAVAPEDSQRAKKAIESEFDRELELGKIDPVRIDEEVSVVAIIGENMQNTPGISGKLFRAFGRNGINVVAIAQGSSELNISTVIRRTDLSKALGTLHDAFFLAESRTLNLFLVGPGLIGSTLLKQIAEQTESLKKHRAVSVRVIAIADTDKMVFAEEGLGLGKWREALAAGEESNLGTFIERLKSLNLPNSVFVDCTSSKQIASVYQDLLGASINIVTPNKVANSGPLVEYTAFKKTALKTGTKFLYETNVGAGLPVIRVLQDLLHCGDEIVKIEGVLSGSLSYIFNSYDGSAPFHEVVRQAKEQGFTEPDPRDDLSGLDVARKILILAREAGLSVELDDVEISDLLPEACAKAPSVDAFFQELEKAEDFFAKLLSDAKAKGEKLCFVATLENGKLNVGLRGCGPDHPFQALSGSDNMISFTTQRYLHNPLVIKGPGAGAEVTAAGVFADIISISQA